MDADQPSPALAEAREAVRGLLSANPDDWTPGRDLAVALLHTVVAEETVAEAALCGRAERHRLYAATPAKYGSAHSKEQMDEIEVASARAVLTALLERARVGTK